MPYAAGLAAKAKPPRDFPSMNAIQGIRGFWDVGGLGLSVIPGQITLLGTIPAGAMILSGEIAVAIGGLAAGGTLDIFTSNLMDGSNPRAIFTARSLDTPGAFFAADTVAGIGSMLSEERRYVFGRINSTLPLTAGRFNALIEYYCKRD
jgi:hypothetical protein